MEYRALGKTGLKVSRLCFGTLTISPLQANLSVREGVKVLHKAFAAGVNFLDTAELYQNYHLLRRALVGWSDQVIVATKSYAYTREGMQASLFGALQSLGREYIDIFLLHEQESEHTLRGHRPALEYLLEAKERGLVRAVGISTHTVAAMRAALALPELEVLHPLYNREGLGIQDGDASAMAAAIAAAAAAGKGVYTMKALGGGHLAREAEAALRFVLDTPGVAAVAVGMRTAAEVDMNVRLVAGRRVPARVRESVQATPRRLEIETWCEGCGRCVAACPQGALHLVAAQDEGRRAAVDQERCLLCGYCAAACPHFYIKVV